MVVLALIQTYAAVGVVGLAQVVALVIIELSILFSLKINAKEYIIIVFNFYFYTNIDKVAKFYSKYTVPL